MLLKKTFFTNRVVPLCCAVFLAFAGMEPVKGEGKEKSELAQLMGGIDVHYKALERLATYLSFDEAEKERKIYDDASASLAALCKTATTKFARPDDDKYQELNQAMLTASENIAAVFKDTNKAHSLEDVLWETGQLRQSCAACHKHLDIRIGSDKQGLKK